MSNFKRKHEGGFVKGGFGECALVPVFGVQDYQKSGGPKGGHLKGGHLKMRFRSEVRT